jgi:membrane-bound serine protease (ClpP class)
MSYGMLTIAGIISMIIGSIMLADSGEEMAKLSLQVALSTGLGVGGFSAWIAYKAVRSLNQKASSGDGVFLGLIGESITNLGPEGTGQVLVNGEIWEAKAQKIIPAGRKVKILARSGLVLEVGEPDS